MTLQHRLPAVNGDDGVWGDELRWFLMQEHYDDGTDNQAANGGHQHITIRASDGTAGTAPITLKSGTLLTTLAIGTIEFNTDKLYFTKTTGPTRQTIAAYDTAGSTGDIYYRDSNANFTALPIGVSNGMVLTVSGTSPVWASGAITIAGTSTSLGGSITQDTITGLSSTGVVKRTGANTLAGGATINDLGLQTGSYNTNNNAITGLPTPSSSSDAATKAYVDAAVAVSDKNSVRVATVGTETYTIASGSVTQISGTTIDGVSPSVNDRILIKDAPAATGAGSAYSSQPGNGIYIVTNNTTNLTLSRTTDMSGSNAPAGVVVVAEAGTANASLEFAVSTPSSSAAFTYGTDSIAWKQIGAPFSGGALPVASGGTGANTLTGIVKGNGTGAFTAVTAPTGTIVGDTDTQTLTHKTIDTASSNTIKINGNTLSATAGSATVTIPNTTDTLAAYTRDVAPLYTMGSNLVLDGGFENNAVWTNAFGVMSTAKAYSGKQSRLITASGAGTTTDRLTLTHDNVGNPTSVEIPTWGSVLQAIRIMRGASNTGNTSNLYLRLHYKDTSGVEQTAATTIIAESALSSSTWSGFEGNWYVNGTTQGTMFYVTVEIDPGVSAGNQFYIDGALVVDSGLLSGYQGTANPSLANMAINNSAIDNTNAIVIKDAFFTLQNSTTTTKQAKFDLSGLSAVTRTYALPDATSGSDTIVTQAANQALTNKTYNKVSLTAPATGSTLTIADGKTLTANNSLTLAAGADGQTFTFPATSATIPGKFSSLIGNGASTSIAVTHNLGTQDVTWSIRDASTNDFVDCDVTSTSTTQITFTFQSAPATNAYKVVIIG